MRAFAAALCFVLFAACEPAPPLRQVMIESPQALRLNLTELPPAVLHTLGLDYGLAVVEAGAFAERAGLRVGDVIYAVNKQPLRGIGDFARIVASRRGTVALQVRRGVRDLYVSMELGAPGLRPATGTLLRI